MSKSKKWRKFNSIFSKKSLKVYRSVFLFSTLCFFCLFILNAGHIQKVHQPVGTEQPYKVIKNPGFGNTKNVLMVVSLPPKESEFYQPYRTKIKHFVNIIKSYWNLEIQMVDIRDYKDGDIDNCDVLFFIEEHSEEIPEYFLDDVLFSKDQEIVWSGFGVDKLISRLSSQHLDLRINKNQAPMSLRYKGVKFSAKDLKVLGKLPESNEKNIGIKILASFRDADKNSVPLIADVNNRYLLLPFEVPSRYRASNYSLIYLDVLHNAFGHNHAKNNKKALLRLEDVNVHTYRQPEKLKEIYNYLKEENIPFQIALIERYLDPNKGIDLEIGEGRCFSRLLKRMVGEGLGTIVQHGYTHQIGNEISGVGYEFWDTETRGPLKNDSPEFVIDKIASVQNGMRNAGLPVPDIWETPHYALSKMDNDTINLYYPLRYECILGVGSLPFVAQIDKTIYFPENLGYAFKEGEDVIKRGPSLEQLSAFENPVASFFWHPWRDIEELKYIVNSIREEGYTFVSVYDLVEKDESASYFALEEFREDYNPFLQYTIIDGLIWIVLFFLMIGSIVHLRNAGRINKYFKIIGTFNLSVQELHEIARQKKKKSLPRIAIFVPARNEGFVINNTILNLVKLDYPKENYHIFIIVDERELDDNVERLTKDIAIELATKLNKKYKTDFIHCLEVPKWYSGEFRNFEKTYEKSTKGRALNFALQWIYYSLEWNDVEMIGILDADGRLDRNILKEVAFKRMMLNSKILQGPIFQVSNFSQVSIVGIVAGLELAIHHLTELPKRLLDNKKAQFLAGTNYFIDKDLITKVSGWDKNALVEDAELALRIYVKTRLTANWLGSPELEQTPRSLSVYIKQRERWIKGHFDLIKDIKKAKLPISEKIYFLNRIFISQFRFLIDLGIPILALTLMISGAFMDLNIYLKFLTLFSLVTSVFIWDTYGFMYRKLAKYIKVDMSLKEKGVQSVKLFLFLPVAMIVQIIPRVKVLIGYMLKSNCTGWDKTERTREINLKQ